MSDLPTRTHALRSTVTADSTVELTLDEIDVAPPGPDEVVIAVAATPINPSDLGLMFAGADLEQASAIDGGGVRVPLNELSMRASQARIGEPMPVGNEGAGTVIAAGESDAAQALVGRAVAVPGGGMYAQHRTVHVQACMVLPEGTPPEAGAAPFVNPMTARAMVETMRDEGHSALVHTAAASQLGQMLNRLCQAEGIGLVNIVRRTEHVDLLREQGAEHVVNSSADSFKSDLEAAVKATGATLAFDAIGGGELPGQILDAMEVAAAEGQEFSRYGTTVNKQVYLYGMLDPGPTVVHRTFGLTWSLGGWLLTPRLASLGRERVMAMRDHVAENLTTIYASSFTDRITLEQALDLDTVARYGRPSTGTKFLITPS
jgi:NADPH2:quinone reductase